MVVLIENLILELILPTFQLDAPILIKFNLSIKKTFIILETESLYYMDAHFFNFSTSSYNLSCLWLYQLCLRPLQ